MTITSQMVKELRDKTNAGMMDCKKALTETSGDMEKAVDLLRQKGLAVAAKRAGRETKEGVVDCYIHAGGKLGVMIEVGCETDFVAKTEDFQKLGKEIAMQVASMKPESVEELLKQDYLRDSSKTIEAMIKVLYGKTGENIRVVAISSL